MIFDKTERYYGDGQWHCPFSRTWVERMKQAAKYCQTVTAEQIDIADNRKDGWVYYDLQPADFPCEPQDERGFPLAYSPTRCRHDCQATYDYDNIPEVVISNGEDDWPLRMWEPVLMA